MLRDGHHIDISGIRPGRVQRAGQGAAPSMSGVRHGESDNNKGSNLKRLLFNRLSAWLFRLFGLGFLLVCILLGLAWVRSRTIVETVEWTSGVPFYGPDCIHDGKDLVLLKVLCDRSLNEGGEFIWFRKRTSGGYANSVSVRAPFMEAAAGSVFKSKYERNILDA